MPCIVEHAKTKNCTTPEYMNLYFKVKGFYFKYVAELPQYKQSIPEFPEWVIVVRTTLCTNVD